MKYLIFILTLMCFYSAKCQDINKRLQKQMWYVKGDIYKGDTCSIHTDKIANCSGYLIFTKDEIEIHFSTTENKFLCPYETLNDNIKLYYTTKFTGANKKVEEVKIYYKLKELAFGNDFELIPITDKDYK